MITFKDLDLSNQLQYSIDDLGLLNPTPIQKKAFPIIRSGKDVVGISQTGTGKTLAYILPILRDLKFSKQTNPRIMILVPTRELVIQVVKQVKELSNYINIRVIGVFGGVNINRHKEKIIKGCDIIIATPGRLYDLAISNVLKLKYIQKLVIDEVDVMLDLGFRFQLLNIFYLIPKRRQNIMFSATMTEDVDKLINDFFTSPTKISINVSGTPVKNISQICYKVPNFYTKINLLNILLLNKNVFKKVIIFAHNKRNADILFNCIGKQFTSNVCFIHANKTQNYRINSIEQFNKGEKRILIATDVISRGIDLQNITHVISFNPNNYPQNYLHRIGRTGRAQNKGESILLFTEKEKEAKINIEKLMNYNIPIVELPKNIVISNQLIDEEKPLKNSTQSKNRISKNNIANPAFHNKKEKNKKINLGGSYKKKLIKKYKKPKTRSQKITSKKNKKNN